MGSISAGVGLISGIDTATLIEQLLSLEARGKFTLQRRASVLQAQQTALLDVNARLLNFKNAASKFRLDKIFDAASATSSNESALGVTASAGAQTGSYQFVVHQLVSSHQVMTRGFADRNATPLGLSSLSFEFGRGRVESDTQLANLNGGEGVGRGKFTITDSAGATAVIDVSTAGGLGEVIDAINRSTGVNVTARVNGDRLEVIDNATGSGTFSIADVTGYTTATDLGIATTDGGAGDGDGSANGVILGRRINTISHATALRALNDGNGVVVATGLDIADFRITDRNGVVHDIVLGKHTDAESNIQEAVTTIEGVIGRINEITGGAVVASIAADGVGLQLTDTTGGGGPLSVNGGVNGERTARDLGLLNTDGVNADILGGQRLLAGLNSVLVSRLNGGSGLGGAANLEFTDRNGQSFSVANLGDYGSLDDLVRAINTQAADAGVGITVALNDARNGLTVTDTSGGGGNLIITGDAATQLGLETDPGGIASNILRGRNLQHQYVAGGTRLSDLNYGRGIGSGTFRITDADGVSATVDVNSDVRTVQDLLNSINSKGLAITARINDAGDGIMLESTSDAGLLALRVDSVSGTASRDLRLHGQATDPENNNVLNGSYEINIEIDPSDTLDQVVAKVKAAGAPISVSVLNTGTGSAPYRLTFASQITGSRGELTIDTGGFDLGLTTLAQAQDARVFFGSSDPAAGVLLTSTTNTLDGVIENVRIDLKAASATPITVTVDRDTQAIVDAVKNFVTTFNDVIGRINAYDKYDSETETKGVLLGEPTVGRLRTALYRTLQRAPIGVEGPYRNLTQIGIKTANNQKGEITLDEAKLREALATDLDAVREMLAGYEKLTTPGEEIFEGVTTNTTSDTFTRQGVAELFAQLLDQYTNSIDGVMKSAEEAFTSRIDLTNKRIAAFDQRLLTRRDQLQRQFAAMESALARLQGQQGALTQLASAVMLANQQINRRR